MKSGPNEDPPVLGISASNWKTWQSKLRRLEGWRESIYLGGNDTVGQRARSAAAMDHLLDFVGPPPARPVLDIGCGDAALALEVGSEGYVGIDPLIGVSAFLRPDGPRAMPPVVRGVGEALPFRSAGFGSVFVRETLDHCLSPRLLLLEAARVLRSDGVLFVQQGIRVPPPAVPLRKRLRVSLGRLKARLLGRAVVDARSTKMFSFDRRELETTVSTHFRLVRIQVQGSIAYVEACHR